MRTPGRCTNHEACWLANGNRDIWVSVADEFACPVCGTPLEAPPMTAITHRGFAAAMVTSLALLLASGGVGFGLVQALRDVAGRSPPALTAQSFAPPKPALAKPHGPEVARAVPPVPTVPAPSVPPPALPPSATAPPVPPPVEVVLGQVTLGPPVPLSVTLPMAAPGPMGPEEFADSDDSVRAARWHRRVPPAARPNRTYVLPAPGWQDNPVDADAIDRANQPYPVAQDDEAAGEASRKLAALLLAEAQGKPVSAVLPPNGGAAVQPDMAPPVTTNLTVPASVRLAMPDDQPAERVDANAAAGIDDAGDAVTRLATLPKAAPEKLAVPAYPEVAAELDRPGRVAVGCTISIRGEPTDCQVRAHAGGTSFVRAVLDWLHSGAVRYKPHFLHGKAVPEARLYKVKFEP